MDVGSVGVCMLCGSVIEYHRDTRESVDFQELARLSYTRRYISLTGEFNQNGKGAVLEELVRLSYTRRYNSLSTDSARDWGMLR